MRNLQVSYLLYDWTSSGHGVIQEQVRSIFESQPMRHDIKRCSISGSKLGFLKKLIVSKKVSERCVLIHSKLIKKK